MQHLIASICLTLSGCSQNFGPGYDFELFKNSPSWELAKAVEKEDINKINEIVKDKRININYREPLFGQTVLHLAIGNDKLSSVKTLLENDANYQIRSFDDDAPIHEATRNIKGKKNSYQILELLIKMGANVNDTASKPNKNDTLGFYVPLLGAIDDFPSAKLLLDHGANPNLKSGKTYLIWFSIFINSYYDEIYVAKYLIVDKRMPVPNIITYTIPDNKPLDALTLLNRLDFSQDSQKQKAKKEILEYLNKIDFPKNGSYKEQ